MNISTTVSVFVSFFFSFFPFMFSICTFSSQKSRMDSWYKWDMRKSKWDGIKVFLNNFFPSVWLKSVQWGFIKPLCWRNKIRCLQWIHLQQLYESKLFNSKNSTFFALFEIVAIYIFTTCYKMWSKQELNMHKTLICMSVNYFKV